MCGSLNAGIFFMEILAKYPLVWEHRFGFFASPINSILGCSIYKSQFTTQVQIEKESNTMQIVLDGQFVSLS